MAKKKDIDLLDEHFKKHRISDKVRSTPVNQYRLNKALEDPNIRQKVSDVYEKFGIKEYEISSKGYAQFRKDKLAVGIGIDSIGNKELEKAWREYQHRDDLIISGQYEDLRAEIFRDNYLKAMEKTNLSPEAILNVQKLSLENWKTIMTLPKSNKKDEKDTLMPHIGGFHYNAASEDYITAVIGEIKTAFDTLGVKYVEEDVIKKKTEIAIAKVKTMRINTTENAYKLDRLISRLPKDAKIRIENEPYRNNEDIVAQKIVVVGGNIPESRIKISKAGNRYIPGVGSTREGTPNEKFMKALLEGYDIYK